MKVKGPDFISIGPHKTGSTWLYSMMREHPGIWLPPKKELWILNQTSDRYMDRLKSYITLTGMPGENLKTFYGRLPVLIPFTTELLWWTKFLILPYKVSGYHHFFPKEGNRLRGDITPNYYFLKENIVRELSIGYPDLKVILTLRNPINRVWSYSKMYIRDFLKDDPANYTTSQFKNLFDSFLSWWIPYYQEIDLWKQYFPNVLIITYELLKASPKIYIQEIFNFLGVCTVSISDSIDINGVINKSAGKELPTSLRIYLIEQYQEEIEILGKRLNDPFIQSWLNDRQL
jgi:hypothetical protein